MTVIADVCAPDVWTASRILFVVAIPALVLVWALFVLLLFRGTEGQERSRLWAILTTTMIAPPVIILPFSSHFRHTHLGVTLAGLTLLFALLVGALIPMLTPRTDPGRGILMGLLGVICLPGIAIGGLFWYLALTNACLG
jgi:hypothetical protein